MIPPHLFRAHVEPLEPRIAPAVLFLSGAGAGPSSLQILDGAGHDAQDSPAETAARALTGATAAVLLQAGDSLIFDRNGNHLLDGGDVPLAEVTAGRGLFFFTDGKTGRRAHAFELTELTGVAASDGFAAEIHTDIHGSVVTALDANGFLTATDEKLTIQHASIAHLTVDGQLARRVDSTTQFGGHLAAGGNLSEISVGGPLYNSGAPVSVAGRIATGNATRFLDFSFDAGAHRFLAEDFVAAAGMDGGDIDHVKLREGMGLLGMAAGGGGPAAPGQAGGDGGSISHVSFGTMRVRQFLVAAGSGAFQPGEGDGGDGGSISDVSAIISSTAKPLVNIAAGYGGPSKAGDGGDGGGIAHLSLQTQSELTRLWILAGGGGGPDTAAYSAGDGGDISDVQLRVNRIIGPHDQALLIQAGGVRTTLPGLGGVGGNVDHLSLTIDGRINGTVEIGAGNGSDGFAAASYDYQGLGGNISNSTVILNASVGSYRASAYGAVVLHAGYGAVGGDIEDVALHNHANRYATQFFAGQGFHGAGGDVRGLHVVDTAPYSSGLMMWAAGGETGGDVVDISITKLRGHLRGIFIQSGSSLTDAGDVEGVLIHSAGDISRALIRAGDSRVHSGGVRDLTIQGFGRLGTMRDPFSIQGGSIGEAVRGDPIQTLGSLEDFSLQAPRSYFRLGGEPSIGLNNVTGGVGATGSSISHISGTVGGIEITASPGGPARDGAGGQGGSVSDVRLKIAESFAHHIVAGDGGAGGLGNIGGAGGSVRDVEIDGDIGDFTKPFGFKNYRSFTQMGGLAAGAAGSFTGDAPEALAGSISHVAAERIAAIVAGQSLLYLTADNAVESISNVSASVIGADTGIQGPRRTPAPGGRTFDFKGTGAGPFSLGADFPIDGLVVVKADGLLTPLPVSPLALVLVGP